MLGFERFEVDLRSGTLRCEGVEVALRPKVLATLLHLVAHRDRVVSKEELVESVWGGLAISDWTIASTVQELRRRLGDDPQAPRFVRTYRGRGYRFVYELRESAPPRSASLPAEGSPFVGRKALLEQAEQSLQRVLEGKGRLLVLAGEPGIGKTRTAEEVCRLALALGFEFHRGRCPETGGAPPFWPWVEVVRSVLGAAGRSAAAHPEAEVLAQLLPELVSPRPPPPESAEHARFRLFDSVSRLLAERARARPIVVVLDDLHRADASSLAMLELVANALGSVPALLLATYRTGELDEAHPLSATLAELARHSYVGRHELEGLSLAEVAELVERLRGRAASEGLVRSLAERTGGNPLFVRHLVESWSGDEGAAERRGHGQEIAPGVRDVVRGRVARLPEESRRVLFDAAVMGREFDPDLLGALWGVGESELAELLEPARRAELVAREAPRFTHALIQETLYASLREDERLDLHLELARRLEALPGEPSGLRLAQLARHYAAAAARGGRERAVEYARRAAEEALERLAFTEAADGFAAVVDLLGADPARGSSLEIARAMERRAAALWFANQRDAARQLFEEVMRLAGAGGDAELYAQAALGFAGRTDVAMDVDRRSVRVLESALERLPRADSALRAEILGRLAGALYYDPDRRRTERLAGEAVAVAERVGDRSRLAYTLSAQRYAVWRPDNLDERLAIVDRCLELALEEADDTLVMLARFWRVVDLLEAAQMQALDREIEAHGALAHRLRQPFYLWQWEALMAMRAHVAGRFAEAEERTHRALQLGQEARSPNALILFGTQLYLVRREQGRLGEMEEMLVGMMRQLPDFSLFPMGLAGLYAAQDERAKAAELFETLAEHDFEDVPFDMGYLTHLSIATRVACYLRDARRAELLLGLLKPYANGSVEVGYANGWDGAVTLYLGMLASLLGEHDLGASYLEDAILRHRLAGAPHLLAHGERELARLLRARGRPRDAARIRSLLESARACYARLGVEPLRVECESLLLDAEPIPRP